MMARITVEDALKVMPNRYELTLVASERAHQLCSGALPLIDAPRDRPTVIALREIAAGKIRRVKSDAGP